MKNKNKLISVDKNELRVIIWNTLVRYPNHKKENDPIVIFYPNNSLEGIDITDSVLAVQNNNNKSIALWIDINTNISFGTFNVYSSRGLWINKRPFYRGNTGNTLHEIVLMK